MNKGKCKKYVYKLQQKMLFGAGRLHLVHLFIGSLVH